MPFAHFTAHVSTGCPSLLVPSRARRLWRSLRTAFPEALAVILMGNHLHLVVLALVVEEALRRLRTTLAVLEREGYATWEKIGSPEILRDPPQLRRNLRYVWQNPIRKKLVSDPLEWPWSTYRDWVGAISDPWLTETRLAATLGDDRLDFRARFHEYCTTHASIPEGGTPLPVAAPPRSAPEVGLHALGLAACACTRQPLDALRRRGLARATFLELATHQGWRNTLALAGACQMTRRAVRKPRAPVGERSLAAAALCLGDRRLLQGVPGSFDPGAGGRRSR